MCAPQAVRLRRLRADVLRPATTLPSAPIRRPRVRSRSQVGASAATLSPSPTRRTSPGTTSSASIVSSRPARVTWAVCVNDSESERTACSALSSCQKPRMPLTTRMAAIAAPSTVSPIATETTVAAMSSVTRGSNSCSTASLRSGARRTSRGRFGPYSRNRRSASPSSRPSARSLRRAASSSSGGRACGAAATGRRSASLCR